MYILAITAVLGFFSAPSMASDAPKTLICGKSGDAPKAVFFLASKSLNAAVASYANGPEMIEADACSLGVAEEFKGDIADPKSVVGACVSITSDGGDGYLSVLRASRPGSYKLEVKPILVEEPSKAPGKTYDCF